MNLWCKLWCNRMWSAWPSSCLTQNTVLITKYLKELLDTDYSDPNTESLGDSIYGPDKDAAMDWG